MTRIREIAGRKGLAALFILVLASLTFAACGDDDDDDDGGATTGAASEAPQGDPIRVGMVCTCSGPQAANALSDEVASAWESFTNDNGGLNGHPVEVVIKDDAGDPARSAQAVRELVEDDKVMAIAGENSLADAAWQQYVEQQNFPVVGGVTYNPAMWTSPVFFPSGGNLLAELYSIIDEAKKVGSTKLGTFYCAEAATCAFVEPLMAGIGSQGVGGAEMVYGAQIAAGEPNYNAQCLGGKDAGVEALFIAASSENLTRAWDQCVRQGFEPTFIGVNGVLTVADGSNPIYDGGIVSMGNLPPNNTEAPGGQEMVDALDEYEPEVTEDPGWNANPAQTWVGLQLYAAAAEAGTLQPTSTPQDVMNALYTLKGETLDGLSGPLTFVKGQPTFDVCTFLGVVEGGEWTFPNGAEPTCLDQQATQSLIAIAEQAAG